MSGTTILVGRLANISGEMVNTRNGQVHKMTLQIITEDSYKDRNGQWVNNTSSFFVTDWGDRGRQICQNGSLEKGFTVSLNCKITNQKGSDGRYYTDLMLDGSKNDLKIHARPKSWHDRRNAQANTAPQDMQQQIPPQNLNPQDNFQQPSDDDIPF